MLRYFMVVGLALLARTASADVMLEPFLGYGLGSVSCTSTTGNSCNYKSTGVELGARLGVKFMPGIWVAAEFDADSGTKWKADSGSVNADFKRTSLGLTAGVDTFVGLRVFAGLGLSEKSTLGTSENFTGSSFKLGAGYKLPLLPLAFNVEYRMITFKDREVSGLTAPASNTYSTLKDNLVVFSVSAPLTF